MKSHQGSEYTLQLHMPVCVVCFAFLLVYNSVQLLLVPPSPPVLLWV